jgi:hypothetical protein
MAAHPLITAGNTNSERESQEAAQCVSKALGVDFGVPAM